MGKKKGVKERQLLAAKVDSNFRISDEDAQKRIASIMEGGLLLILDCGCWGNRKRLSSDLAEEWFGDNKNAVRAVQDLIDKEQWNNVLRPMRKAQAEVRDRLCLPWYLPGFYYLKLDRMQKAEEILTTAHVEMLANFDEFAAAYPELKRKFKEEHPKLYQESNYPSVEQLKAKLRFRWSFQLIQPPMGTNGTSLKFMSKDQIEMEERKWREQVKEAGEYGIKKMREAFAAIITHLRDVLVDPSKVFQETTVEKPKQFLAEFKDFSIWGDKPFETLAAKAEKLLDGVYAEDLREDTGYRELIGKAVNDVVKQFEKLPTVEMDRALDF